MSRAKISHLPKEIKICQKFVIQNKLKELVNLETSENFWFANVFRGLEVEHWIKMG